jgi:hypothetical protein
VLEVFATSLVLIRVIHQYARRPLPQYRLLIMRLIAEPEDVRDTKDDHIETYQDSRDVLNICKIIVHDAEGRCWEETGDLSLMFLSTCRAYILWQKASQEETGKENHDQPAKRLQRTETSREPSQPSKQTLRIT